MMVFPYRSLVRHTLFLSTLVITSLLLILPTQRIVISPTPLDQRGPGFFTYAVDPHCSNENATHLIKRFISTTPYADGCGSYGDGVPLASNNQALYDPTGHDYMVSVQSSMMETLLFPVLFIPILCLVTYAILSRMRTATQWDSLGLLMQNITLGLHWCGLLFIFAFALRWYAPPAARPRPKKNSLRWFAYHLGHPRGFVAHTQQHGIPSTILIHWW